MAEPGVIETKQKSEQKASLLGTTDIQNRFKTPAIWCLRIIPSLVLFVTIIAIIVLSADRKTNLFILVDVKKLKDPYTQYHIYLRDLYPQTENVENSTLALEQMTEYHVSKVAIPDSNTKGEFDAFRKSFFPNHTRATVRGIAWGESKSRIPFFVYDNMRLDKDGRFPLSTTFKSYETIWETINDIRAGELYETTDMDALYAMSKLARGVYVLEKRATDPGEAYQNLNWKPYTTGQNLTEYIRASNYKTWHKTETKDSDLAGLDSDKTNCLDKIKKVSFGGVAYLEDACTSNLNDKIFDGWMLDDRFKLKIPAKKLLSLLDGQIETSDKNKFRIQVGSEWYIFSKPMEYIFPRLIFDTTSKQCTSDDLASEDEVQCVKSYNILAGLPPGPKTTAPLCAEKPEDDYDDAKATVYNLYSPLAAFQVWAYERLIMGKYYKEWFSPHVPDVKITLKKISGTPSANATKIEFSNLDVSGETLSMYDLIKELEDLDSDTMARYSKAIFEQNFYFVKDSQNYELSCMKDSDFFADKMKTGDDIKYVRNFFELENFAGSAAPAILPFVVSILLLVVFGFRYWDSPSTDVIFDRYTQKEGWDWLIVIGELAIFSFMVVLTILGFMGFQVKNLINDNFSVGFLNQYYVTLQVTGMLIFIGALITSITYILDQFYRVFIRQDIGSFTRVKPGAVYVSLAALNQA